MAYGGSSTYPGLYRLRDILSGNRLAKAGSQIGMISILLMAFSPTLGGYIQTYFGWRAVFFMLLIYTLSIWLFCLMIMPETNQYLNKDATKLNIIINNYHSLVNNKTFLGYTLCSCCAYAGFLAYLTSSPFLLQILVGLTPIQFGWLIFLTSGSIIICGFINSHLVIKKGIKKMVSVGNLLMVISGISMLVFGLLGFLNAFVIILPITLYAMGGGFTFSNAYAGAFHQFDKMTGTGTSLYSSLQVLSGAVVSAIIAMIHVRSQIPLAITLSILGIIALFSLQLTEEIQE